MARSSEKAVKASRRPFLWLAIFIGALIVAYSGVWYYLASQLETRSEFLISDLANRNVDADCADMEVRGFPFRLGVFCNAVTADDQGNRMSLTTGGFRSAAQVYRPNHIVSELDGPVTLNSSDGSSAALNWKVLRSSTVFNLSGLTRASLLSSDFDGTVTPPATTDPLKFKAGSTEAHVRQNDADLDAVLSLNSATLTTEAAAFALPPFDVNADLTLADRAWMLSGQQRSENPWHDLSASLNSFSIDLGQGARLSLNGPFSIDDSGYLTGKFDLEIEGREAWQSILTEAFPDAADSIANIAGMVGAIGQTQDKLSLPLNIDRGRIRISFFTLGQIPPI